MLPFRYKDLIDSKGHRMKKRIAGLSLIEILISLVILSIGIGFGIRVFSTGRYFIQGYENKGKGISIATMQMDRYLSKSYSGLNSLITAGNSVIVVADADPNFTSTITLTSKKEVNAALGINIPYIQLEVVTTYKESNVGGTMDTKSVRLVNIIPYPYYHMEYADCDFTLGCVGNDPAKCAVACPPVAAAGMQKIASLSLSHQTKKNLMIIYNLGLQGVAGTGIQPIDTIDTQAYLNGVPLLIRTSTPILTQPFISNVVAQENVPAVSAGSPQIVDIYWSKSSVGRIELKWVNLIVLEIEP